MSSSDSSLVEVVLSSTVSNSPLPLTSLHSLETGQVLHSFKSPPPPTTTTTTSTGVNGKGKGIEHAQEGGNGNGQQTMSWIQGGFNGVGGCLVGLGGKDGRAVLNVWNLTRESTIARLIPPVRLTVLTTSPLGEYIVGGTQDGRIFLWDFQSGQLLSTLDAHYREITCLEFTRDGSCLLTGSQDGGISLWSLGRILNSTPLNPTTPFTTLSDHTLGITCLKVGHLGSSFPNSRVFSGSKDGTVKIWDLSTTQNPSSLLSTFQFDGPVQHLAVDPLERFFFVSIPITTTSSSSEGGGVTTSKGSKILRVNMYKESKDSSTGGGRVVTAVAGTGSIGELERIDSNSNELSEPGMSYKISEQTISSIHLSNHSPTLLISTLESSQIQILSLTSLLPIRIISPPPASTPYGGISFLTTFLYQPSTSSSATGGGGKGGGVEREVATSLGRSVISVEERERGGKNGKTVYGRILLNDTTTSSVVVEELIQPVGGLNSLPTFNETGFDSTLAQTVSTTGTEGGGLGGDREVIEKLEKELSSYRKGLERVNQVNERIWKSVVEGTISSSSSS